MKSTVVEAEKPVESSKIKYLRDLIVLGPEQLVTEHGV